MTETAAGVCENFVCFMFVFHSTLYSLLCLYELAGSDWSVQLLNISLVHLHA